MQPAVKIGIAISLAGCLLGFSSISRAETPQPVIPHPYQQGPAQVQDSCDSCDYPKDLAKHFEQTRVLRALERVENKRNYRNGALSKLQPFLRGYFSITEFFLPQVELGFDRDQIKKAEALIATLTQFEKDYGIYGYWHDRIIDNGVPLTALQQKTVALIVAEREGLEQVLSTYKGRDHRDKARLWISRLPVRKIDQTLLEQESSLQAGGAADPLTLQMLFIKRYLLQALQVAYETQTAFDVGMAPPAASPVKALQNYLDQAQASYAEAGKLLIDFQGNPAKYPSELQRYAQHAPVLDAFNRYSSKLATAQALADPSIAQAAFQENLSVFTQAMDTWGRGRNIRVKKAIVDQVQEQLNKQKQTAQRPSN